MAVEILSFTSINLPRLGIEARGDVDRFYQLLDERMDLVIRQLMHRFKIQCRKKVRNYPFLMGQGIWLDSEKLDIDDSIEEVIKHGTLSVGFIGLAETLKALIGVHHGESEAARSWDWKLSGTCGNVWMRNLSRPGLISHFWQHRRKA